MNAKLTCPACGHFEPVPQNFLGQNVRCPSCRAIIRVTSSELKTLTEPLPREPRVPPAADGLASPAASALVLKGAADGDTSARNCTPGSIQPWDLPRRSPWSA